MGFKKKKKETKETPKSSVLANSLGKRGKSTARMQRQVLSIMIDR